MTSAAGPLSSSGQGRYRPGAWTAVSWQAGAVPAASGRFDLVDETFVAASPLVVAAAVADPQARRGWWPQWQMTVFMDRGVRGTRWTVAGRLDRLPVSGSAELWLEPVLDGVVLHHYLRLVVPATASAARLARARRRYVRRWKEHAFALKDRLEADRPVGGPAVGSSGAADLPTTPE